ncbi:MAG: Sensor protein CitS [Pelotomaculum sp. PtaB.Bin104]|nr:MAG: Sensor protein CitS [Pelotomaculum sp. PtaB.Bin104]
MDHMSALELIIISFPEAMLVAALGITLAGFKPRLKQLAIIGIFHGLASCIIRSSQVPFGLHTIILLLVFILIINAVTRLNLKTSALAALTGLTIYVAVELLIAPQVLKITGYTYEKVLADTLLRFYFFLPEALILALITFLCRRFNINIMSYWKRNKKNGNLFVLGSENTFNEDFFIRQYFPLITLVLSPIFLLALLNITFFVFRSGSLTDKYLSVFTTFISFAVIALSGLSTIAVKKLTEAMEAEYTAKKTSETLSRMGELIASIRKQRHDFNHHLQAVYGLIEVESFQEAREYIRKTFSIISTHGDLIKTDNHEISAMLYTKIGVAEARSINLDIIVKCSLKDLPLSAIEANSVLGNLIDNALDAVENTDMKKPFVTVEVYKIPNTYIFRVTNQGKPIQTQLFEKIFEPHFTTKGKQGLGLAIVKEIVQNYGGSVNLSSNDDETIFTVSIPSKRWDFN